MPRETTEDIVVTRDRIIKLRQKIADIAEKLRAHIGAGGDAHTLGDLTHPGFMDPDMYVELLNFQDKLNELKVKIETLTIPTNGMLWWWGDPNDIPEGYVLCTGYGDTINFSDKYVMGIKTDSELWQVAGGTFISYDSIPVARHRHSFNNWCEVECNKELNKYVLPSNSLLKLESRYSNQLGSSASGSTTGVYPLYISETTNSSGTTASSSSGITIQPPYVALNVIKKTDTDVPIAADGVGTVHIIIGNSMPDGVLELNGATVSSSAYSALTKYASSNNLTIESAQYTSMINTYGSCPYFVYDATAATLRLPTLCNVITARSVTGDAVTAAKEESPHFHGMGDCPDNQGTWGYYSYTGTYPSGTTGLFWNGNGGHTLKDAPVTNGVIITSNNISTGTSGNGYIWNSTNITFGIRAYHPDYSDASTAAVATASLETDATTYQTQSADSDDYVADRNSCIDVLGWQIFDSGLMYTWGQDQINAILNSDQKTATLIFPLSFTEKTINVKLQNTNSESSQPWIIEVTPASATIALGPNFQISDTIKFKALGV